MTMHLMLTNMDHPHSPDFVNDDTQLSVCQTSILQLAEYI